MPVTRSTSRAPKRRRALRGGHLSLVVGLLVVVAGCSGTAGTAAPGSSAAGGASGVTIRLGYFPNITHSPALVAKQKRLFEARLGSATVEYKSFNAGPAAVEAIFADALDITYIGPNPSINAYQKSNGSAVRIVAGSTSGGAALVVRPEIGAAGDLRGKTVASPQLGNTQDVALRTWLQGQGLKTDTSGGGDVSVKPQENADTLTAFKSGDIAGAWVPEPWVTRLVQEGGGKVLVDERTLWPDGKFVTTDILVRKQFLDAHPDQVKAVLEGHLDAIDLIERDPAGAQKAANDEIRAVTQKALPEAVIGAAWKNLTFTADPLAATLQRSADAAKNLGQLKSSDVRDIYDLTLLNAVLQARGKPAVKGLG